MSTQFNTLLVPIDFSAASRPLVRYALRIAGGENPVVILLHVVDSSMVEYVASHDFGARADVSAKLRERAQLELSAIRDSVETSTEIDVLVCEGRPFLEILQKAEDFAVDATVLGRVGSQQAFEKLLFGSTAEKVLRGSKRPVIVLPVRPE